MEKSIGLYDMNKFNAEYKKFIELLHRLKWINQDVKSLKKLKRKYRLKMKEIIKEHGGKSNSTEI